MPPQAAEARWSASFLASCIDRNGDFAGGSQIIHLVAHKGQLYAANGYWMDMRNPIYGHDRRLSAWSQVLRLTGACMPLTGYRRASVGVPMNDLGPDYAGLEDDTLVTRYRARCFCGAVRYEVGADPVDAKFCHCRICQALHGAPMQWAAIFHKRHVRMIRGIEHLRFYSAALDRPSRLPPCKVSCALCGTPIADEGRRMWLAFPTLFEFCAAGEIPESFRPTCHIFYGQRVVDVDDGLPKWSGHKHASEKIRV